MTHYKNINGKEAEKGRAKREKGGGKGERLRVQFSGTQ